MNKRDNQDLELLEKSLIYIDDIVSKISNALPRPTSGFDELQVKREGNKTIMIVTYRRLKVPFKIDEILMKVGEMIFPPFRNPKYVKLKKLEVLQDGVITQRIKAEIELPVYGLISTGKIRKDLDKIKKRL